MANEFAILTITYAPYLDGVVITVTTDVPCTLTLYWTENQPVKQVKSEIFRGIALPKNYRYCFTNYTGVHQDEPADSTTHTFDITPWHYCETRYFTFRATIAGVESPSVTPIFEYHHPGYFIVTDFPMKMKPAITRWVIPGWYSHGYSTGEAVAERIYYIPIFVTETTTYIRIGIYVSTAQVGNCDLRIYNWIDGLPASQILSAGVVFTSTIGAKEKIISQQLTRGYYFLAYRCTANPSLRTPGITRIGNTPVPGISDTGGSNALPGCCLSVDATFADPAPAPTALAWAYNAAVFLREN